MLDLVILFADLLTPTAASSSAGDAQCLLMLNARILYILGPWGGHTTCLWSAVVHPQEKPSVHNPPGCTCASAGGGSSRLLSDRA
jgi:hypothetical protein